jgi:NAD(P)-dependent dehydrogenase (short-subunit alcohol dehydrogenase family)
MTRVVLITGASRGIGAATARLAAERGDDVAVNYTRNTEAAVIEMFDSVTDRLGPVDVLVNNAGILHTQMRFDEMSVGRWRELLDVNVIGAFVCAREAVRRMSTRHGGRGGAIVNVSSAASYLGSPGEYVDYAASKAAIDTLTIGLGREVAGEGVRVNAVRPGVIHTEIHASGGEPGRVERVAPSVPMQRGGDPIEVARTILWLASDEASYITGTIVNCAGGR